jgi:DNA-binding NtrC family response regulator
MNPKAKILIVDDEEVVRRSYVRILAATDYSVHAVWTWMQVTQLMQQEPFDIVLLDLRMPGMDGMTVLRVIKQCWPDSKVIIITGYPTIESVKEAITLGVYDYLTKPVGPDQVINVTNNAVLHKKWALHREVETEDTNRPDTQCLKASGNTIT